MEKIKIYTVSELTRDINILLEDVFREVWVEGEISNYTRSSAGHFYFSLKDENCIINAVLFRGNSARMDFNVENGMRILCKGKISVYEKKGAYQLYVQDIEPRGRGALQLKFDELKRRLYEEGLFDEKNKKALPVLPLRVGVVTSPTGAAIRDILKVAKRRYPNIEISIRPVKVQGEGAKEEIVRAIEELNEISRLIKNGEVEGNPIDVMIVGRGGGSLEDLWPFNEEIVARAIFSSEIPVVSAVGHEIDYTISDFVADVRAATPSQAAEIVIPLKSDLLRRLKGSEERMAMAAKSSISAMREGLKALRESYVLRTPENALLKIRQEIDGFCEEMFSLVSRAVETRNKDLGAYNGKLKALSPLAVLERGYSITFKNGKIIRSHAETSQGDLIETRLFSGKITSRVEETVDK